MREAFINKEFKPESIRLIDQANVIIRKFQQMGYKLTLRQLYYQFVAGAIIENTLRSYKRLGSLINDARLAGLIDWDALEDRTRNLETLSHWSSPEELLEACENQYRRNHWEGQAHYCEVWVEKEAIEPLIDHEQLDKVCGQEEDERSQLATVRKGWNNVLDFLGFGDD